MLYRFDGKQPKTGNETYVSEHALVIGDVTIGDNCYVGHGAIIRGDYGSISIGSNSVVEEGVIIHAPPQSLCDIGKGVVLGHGAIIHSARIGDFVVIGMGATVSIRSEVGEGTIIGEGALVKMRQSIPPGVVAGGTPAVVLREVTRKDRDFWDSGRLLYSNLAKQYLSSGLIPV